MNGYDSGHFNSIDDLPRGETSFVPGKLLLKLSVGKPGSYVLRSCTASDTHTKFAVALSDRIVKIFDVHGKLWDEYVLEKSVTYMKFSSTDPPILFTSSSDGKIQVWDTRCQGPVQTFIDNSDGALKPILCFDYNYKNEIICAGTEMIREDSFLLFWDRRTSKILGGYWNSHSGDITQIHFNPTDRSVMGSSSVDGLINVFDLNKTSEEDALIHTLNIESPVNTFCWRAPDILSCTTSIEEFHVWGTAETQPGLSMPRKKVHDKYQIKVDYFVESLEVLKQWHIATGNNKGVLHLWNSVNNDFHPVGFILEDGHSDAVRTICYSRAHDVVLTGGDDGCICFWRVSEEAQRYRPIDVFSCHSVR